VHSWHRLRHAFCTICGVRVVAAAIPSTALLAGSALALAIADGSLPTRVADVALGASAVVALAALIRGCVFMLALAVSVGFFAGGARLADNAWQHAWPAPLRLEFDRLARDARSRAEQQGRRLPEDPDASAEIVGVLTTDAADTPNGVSLSVDVFGIRGLDTPDGRQRRLEPWPQGRASPLLGGIVVTVLGSLATERAGEWRAGRFLRFPAQLRRPARYFDPGVPDAERAMARRGVTLVGTVKSGALVAVLAKGPWPNEVLAAARGFARRAISDAVGRWDPQSAAIVAAIVVGDRSSLDDSVQRRLQEAGTYHVIAISGGNIAILAGLIVGGFQVAGRLGRGAMASAIAILIAYAAFVGGGASVNRATLMAVLYFGGRLFDQRSPPVNGVAVAAGVLVLENPLSITDPAFVLTFGATIGILVIVPGFDLKRLPSAARTLASMFLASAAAEALLFPIGALLFSRVTFAGLALNFLAIPLMSIAQVAGMSVVPLAVVPWPAAVFAGWVAHLGATGLIWSANLVRFAPAVTWRVAAPPLPACFVYYTCFAAAWIGWQRSQRILGSRERRALRVARYVSAFMAVGAAVWILIDPHSLVASRGDGRLHVTFIDVGQGDAAFIVFPLGSTLLVDAGGLGFASSFDVGGRVVAPVIRSIGFRHVGRIALTHGDPDHIGGAPSIIREFRPREIWEGIPVPRLDALAALRTEANNLGARWSNVHAGDFITVDGALVSALHPEREDWERQKVRNDDSLVLELRWRDVSVVLTGDAGRIPEQRIASALAPARLRVVKVPHHGSLTSSSPEFVQRAKPSIAVVSAGRNNHFGHPVPEVLARYTSVGAQVYRTDRDGAVTIETDGWSIWVRTYINSNREKQ
jgi:competence protein ComEC